MQRKAILYGALLVQSVAAQTRIDLSRQTRNIDLRSAHSTQPAKSGTALPPTCQEAEVFIHTTAPDGNNVYVCAGGNRWIPQGAIHVKGDGTSVGTTPAQNFLSGFGVTTSTWKDGEGISIRHSIDDSLVQTYEKSQSGRALLCSSSSNSATAYTCALDPPLTRYTMGMLLRWIPDVPNTGPATLKVDALGSLPLRTSDGASTLSAGSITPGRLHEIWYDGSGFRLPTTTTLLFQGNGVPLGTPATVDYTQGNGITVAMADAGTKMTVQMDADTSYLLSKAVAQSGSVFLATDNGDDDDYTPTMSPPLTTYTPGMFILLRVSIGTTGESTTNIDTLGPVHNKESDGTTDASLLAGVPYLMFYDGAVFRKLAPTTSQAPSKGVWLGSPESNSGNLSITAPDKIYLQSIYVSEPWTLRRLLLNTSAPDTLGSACLYSWAGPSTTTATLVASTPPASLSAEMDDRAIREASVTIYPGWYLAGFTGHQGQLAIKRGENAGYYTPVPGQELSSGLTDGSCPLSVSGITTNWTATSAWRIGWRY